MKPLHPPPSADPHPSPADPSSADPPPGPAPAERRVVHLLEGELPSFLVGALLRTISPPPEIRYVPSASKLCESTDESAPGCVVKVVESPRDQARVIRTIERSDSISSVLLLTPALKARLAVRPLEHAAVQILPWPACSAVLHRYVRRALDRSSELKRVRETRASLLRRFEDVTPREMEVLRLLKAGHSSKSIAAALRISKRTVDAHRSALLRKTRSPSALALVHDSDRIELFRSRERALTHGRWRPELPDAPLVGESAGRAPAEPMARATLVPRRPRPYDELAETARRADLELLEVRLAELERSEDSACVLDRGLCMVWTNPAWSRFAPRPEDRRRMTWEWGLGRRYVDAISPPLADWYAARLERAFARGEGWQHEYECPAPARRQRFLLEVEPGDACLVLRHRRVASSSHQSAAPQAAGGAEDEGIPPALAPQCMECRRTRLPRTGRWTLIRHHVAAARPPMDWVLCPDCDASYAAS